MVATVQLTAARILRQRPPARAGRRM